MTPWLISQLSVSDSFAASWDSITSDPVMRCLKDSADPLSVMTIATPVVSKPGRPARPIIYESVFR
jgi:hypothetical protein